MISRRTRAGVDQEDAFARVGVSFVDDDDAGGNAGAIEEIAGQADDPLDVALPDKRAANIGLGIAPEQDAVRENAASFAAASE